MLKRLRAWLWRRQEVSIALRGFAVRDDGTELDMGWPTRVWLKDAVLTCEWHRPAVFGRTITGFRVESGPLNVTRVAPPIETNGGDITIVQTISLLGEAV
jgi:hypothetical protein